MQDPKSSLSPHHPGCLSQTLIITFLPPLFFFFCLPLVRNAALPSTGPFKMILARPPQRRRLARAELGGERGSVGPPAESLEMRRAWRRGSDHQGPVTSQDGRRPINARDGRISAAHLCLAYLHSFRFVVVPRRHVSRRGSREGQVCSDLGDVT